QEVHHPDLEQAAQVSADYEEKLLAARALMNSAKYREAMDLLEQMRSDPDMPEEFTEDVLYAYAEANFQHLRGDLGNNFPEIITPFERAMHYDPESSRVPEILLNLGYVHLQVGNEPEARGYFNLLRDDYPDHSSVPSTYFYWGDYYEKKGQYQQAADAYESIVQKYPEDDLVKPAALRLARALSELDYPAQALDILNFIETRWPRYHIDDPDYLNLAGYIMYRNDKLDQARQRFLHYINLRPQGDQVAVAMARIGDIYLREGKKQAAKDIHEETVRKYPDEEGGLIAAMRLAEEGIYDDPEISDFDRPFSMRPRAIYKRISEEFPESPLAPVALLKLAMWDLTHGYFDYQESLDAIQRFYEMYQHKELWPRALEVGFKAFSGVVEDLFPEEDYKGIIDTYESYPFLNEHPDQLNDDSRLALATSYWNRDNIEQALIMARPFLEQDTINESNQAALSLILSIYMETADWEEILGLADEVRDWDLPRDDRLQVRYARALALQNLEQGEEALPIWRELAVEADFPTRQKAHVLFFLARHAYNEQDYKNTYVFAQESLALFMEQEKQNLPRIMTCLDMLMDATAETGRLREALVWALEYQDYIDEEDPDWPAFQYRLAKMYRLNHRYQEWEDVLGRIIRDFPDSVYSRMARSELKSRELTQEAGQYQP
ncbi:MAG: tetratricopeptide repeat protein, partial [Desulfonatronovibrionaceae bacterium]